MIKRLFLLTAMPLILAACGDSEEVTEVTEAAAPVTEEAAPAAAMPSPDDADYDALLASILGDEDRVEGHSDRDAARKPAEVIHFFDIETDDTVVEIWPGGGWYTEILARYLASGGGKLIAAGFDPASENPRIQQAVENFQTRYVADTEEFGTVEMTALSQQSQDIAEPGTADFVVTFRNVHNFEMGGWAPEAFASFYAALKPGGVLGVVDHRLSEDADKAREMDSGYVKVSTVRQLAEGAGFVFDGSSEILANPADDTDHPFGVWTLPPSSRTSDRDGTTPEGFNAEEYLAIGESDRMTLRFVKPIEPAEALLE